MLTRTNASDMVSTTPCTRLGSWLVMPLRISCAHAGQGKDHFDDDGAAEQVAHAQPQHGHGSDQRVAETFRETTPARGTPLPMAVRT